MRMLGLMVFAFFGSSTPTEAFQCGPALRWFGEVACSGPKAPPSTHHMWAIKSRIFSVQQHTPEWLRGMMTIKGCFMVSGKHFPAWRLPCGVMYDSHSTQEPKTYCDIAELSMGWCIGYPFRKCLDSQNIGQILLSSLLKSLPLQPNTIWH